MTDHQQTLTDFHTLTERFGSVVAAAPADRWSAPSPCEGWVGSDVLDHVIDSQRDFLSRHELDLGPRPTGTPAEIWQAHAAAVKEALGDGSVLATEFDSYFGPSTIGDTVSTFYNLDLIVHRWDVARAVGTDTTFSDAEMDHTEACLDQLGDNLYAHGACAPALDPPAGASRQVRILARTGRLA